MRKGYQKVNETENTDATQLLENTRPKSKRKRWLVVATALIIVLIVVVLVLILVLKSSGSDKRESKIPNGVNPYTLQGNVTTTSYSVRYMLIKNATINATTPGDEKPKVFCLDGLTGGEICDTPTNKWISEVSVEAGIIDKETLRVVITDSQAGQDGRKSRWRLKDEDFFSQELR